MKKVTNIIPSLPQILVSFFLLFSSTYQSQSPLGISYQALMRNADGNIMTNNAIDLNFKIHDGSADGTIVYEESHALTSNAQGLVACVVGQGIVLQGNFSNINWGSGAKFLHVMMGNTDLGTQQMLSVPYALYAAQSGTPGPAGPAGANGATGPQGPIGMTGPIGPAGPTGPAGATGAQGPIGLTGPSGAQGEMGPQGPAGISLTGGGFSHWIGELFGGGVVFHVYRDALGEEHGLICSLTDLSTNVEWGLYEIDIPNCESSWNGAANTSAIIAAGVATYSAANLCDEYISDGFIDWYLPAIEELQLMQHSKYSLNRSLSQIAGATAFVPSSIYWSSTEYYSLYATKIYFYDGSINRDFKNLGFSVRAVRSF
jgi:hypothetical protein